MYVQDVYAPISVRTQHELACNASRYMYNLSLIAVSVTSAKYLPVVSTQNW